MDHLPDDCLFRIFYYGSLNEKFFLQSICKRWQILFKRLLRNQKILQLNIESHRHDTLIVHSSKITDVLPAIFESCPHLEVIDAPDQKLFIDQLIPIAGTLKKIKCDTLSWLKSPSDADRSKLLMNFNALKHITVKKYDCPRDLSYLCDASSSNLEYVQCETRSWLYRDFNHVMNHLPASLETLRCLNWDLPENLESIAFARGVKELNMSILEEPFNFPSLEHISCCSEATKDFFDCLAKSTNLKKITLDVVSADVSGRDITSFFKKATSLEQITLRCPQLTSINSILNSLLKFNGNISLLELNLGSSISDDETMNLLILFPKLQGIKIDTSVSKISLSAIEKLFESPSSCYPRNVDLVWKTNRNINRNSTLPESLSIKMKHGFENNQVRVKFPSKTN